jgi:plasmid stabilization system protein ParE
MKAIYSRRALRDLETIHSYLSTRSAVGAKKVVLEIRRATDFIGDNPASSERADIPNVRVKWVRGYAYKIFYETVGDTITILHIRHTSREVWRL